MLTRDDLPPTSPTPISGFLSLKKHKTRARPTLPQMEASDFTSELYSTIRRRKSERGKNYNPMDPTLRQVMGDLTRLICQNKMTLCLSSSRPHLEERLP